MNELITNEEQASETALAFSRAQHSYDQAVYEAEIAWHNAREQAWHTYQDETERATEQYRNAVGEANRQYRKATADYFR